MAAVPTVPIARSLCHSVSPVRLRRAAGFQAHLELTWNRCVGRRCCCCCCVARLAEHCPNLVPSSAPCHWEPSSRVGCAAPTPARPLTATPNLKQVVVSLCAVGGSYVPTKRGNFEFTLSHPTLRHVVDIPRHCWRRSLTPSSLLCSHRFARRSRAASAASRPLSAAASD